MYHVRIKDGKCTAHRGPSVDAELSINSPAEVWKAISKGEIPGLQSYMDGKYQWSGDLNIIMILDNLFEKTGAQNSPADGTHTRKGEEETITDKSTLNCHDIIAGMPTVFDAGAAGDLIADIQFDISGKEPGSYHLHIEQGTCSFLEGEASSPSLTIHTPSEVWMAVSRGEIDGQAALMQGKYTVDGDFNLLLKLNEIFL